MQSLKQGGLNKEKLKKSSKLHDMMNLAVQRADEVRKKKLKQIEQAQKEREITVQQNLKERQLKSQKAVLVKENEKKLIAARNEKARKASIIRLQQNESSIDEAIAAKDEIIRQKALEGQQRAEQEKKKVFLLAQQKADVPTQKNVESQRRKKQLELQDEQASIAAEKLRQEQRMINARRADIERMFTRVQLEALREQFDEADADNSDSIDANELMAVCQSLGENLSMKQVKALIAEVDDDGSGEIEWEEYLIIMGKKRNDAMKKGSGLFQKMSMRADEAANKKQEQIAVAQRAKEENYELQEFNRKAAVKRAEAQKIIEQQKIVDRNIIKEEEAMVRVEEVEIEKEMQLRIKAQKAYEKEQLGRQRVIVEKNKIWEQAEAKRLRTESNLERAAWLKNKQIYDEEQKIIEAEKLRVVKRQSKVKRADVERQFTRVQLEALREQFDEADADNSDSIDANELMAVCQSLGENVSMKQVKQMIAEVDDDGSGEIEWDEYLIIMGKKRKDAMKKGEQSYWWCSVLGE